MSDFVIVDTDILIDAGMEVDQAVNCLKYHEEQAQLAVSIITKMELVVGCRNKMNCVKLKNSFNDLRFLL